jgi:hypothetical protein
MDGEFLKPDHDVSASLSHLLPGTKLQFAWDSTSLGLLKTCPRLYELTILEGYTPRDESVHLRFGGEFHTALEQYDHSRANGVRHEDAIHDVVRELLIRTVDFDPSPDTKAGKYKSRENLIQLVIDYLDHFGEDPAVTFIKEDGTPAVELSFRFELDWGPGIEVQGKQYMKELDDPQGIREFSQPYLLCGHLDRVVHFNDQLMVLDRKTTQTTLTEYFFRQFEPNNQMTLYILAGRVVLGTMIKGIIIDGCQILLESPNRFVRGMTYRTEDQIEEWLGDLKVLLAQAESYAQANHWPMNDTACDKFGGCQFRGICSKSPQVRERFLRADFEKLEEGKRWNPLIPR